MARVGVDIDDVIYPWYDRAHELCVEAGITNGVTPTRWSVYEEYGCTLEEWVKVLVDAGESVYTLPPEPGAILALRRLYEAGHDIVFVTARGSFGSNGEQIKAWTKEWVARHVVFPFELHFSKDKTAVQTDYFIDDNADNVRALTAAGVMAYLRDRPWNTAALDLPRLGNVVEFVDTVLALEQRDQPRTLRDEVRTVSSTGGEKGQKSARLGSIDPTAILTMAEVAGFGEAKYSRLNYMRGYPWSLSFDAAQRHLLQFWSGVDNDDESGLPHLAHAAWHCLAMLAFLQKGLGDDDRYRDPTV